jgi:hypothetical protein
VRHRSWQQLVRIVDDASRGGSHRERRLLRELRHYLSGVITMQDLTSNWTYVVALSARTPLGWGLSFLDVVLKHRRYFHPYGSGGGWPRTPPNYLGFRWGGRLRQLHHVESYKVVDSLNDEFQEIPRDVVGTHIVYDLGPAMIPSRPVPNGAQYRAARLWAALDLLLTAPTLKEALAQTKARQRMAAQP